MKKIIIYIDLFYRTPQDITINDMMHSADLFKDYRQFVRIMRKKMMAYGNDWKTFPIKFDEIKNTCPGEILFMGVITIENPREVVTWFREGIQSLSINNKGTLTWILFKDMLESLGYIVETDNNICVKSIR